MPTAVRCVSPIQGLVLRITKLNPCGIAVTGSTAGGAMQIVTDGFVQVQDAPQYDNGSRKITRKANGTLCQNFKSPDQFTNDQLTIDICNWNPGIIPAVLNGRLLAGTEAPTGTGFAIGTQQNSVAAHWSLEVWQAPPQSCAADGIIRYPYHAWPHIADGKRGQMTISEDATMLQIIGNTYDSSPLWTIGNTYLGAGQIQQGDHYAYNLQNTAPPPSNCLVLDV